MKKKIHICAISSRDIPHYDTQIQLLATAVSTHVFPAEESSTID